MDHEETDADTFVAVGSSSVAGSEQTNTVNRQLKSGQPREFLREVILAFVTLSRAVILASLIRSLHSSSSALHPQGVCMSKRST